MFIFNSKIKIFFIILILLLFAVFLLSRGHTYGKNELSYGVTFSKMQAEALNLKWQDVFLSILQELKVKNLRLAAYWNEVEPAGGDFKWQDLDWQIEQASKNNAKIILAIGGRLPRWPECHFPGWTDDLTKSEREAKILNYIRETVKRYKDMKNITAWQIENEPFLSHFGECPEVDGAFLDDEIAAVKKLDSRPVVVTDSGELSFWIPAAKRADIFGTTMYRDTYSKFLKRYIHYPIEPGFFKFKKNIASLFAHPQKWIVIELQAEPWGKTAYQNLTQAERDKTMNLDKFKEILEFSRQAGFNEFYLWGAEYWYWEREKGRPEMWEEAKKLFGN